MKTAPSLHSLSRPVAVHASARRIPAWVVPAAIAAGFALLFIALFKDRLLPAPKVELARVLATPADPAVAETSIMSSGTMLFQASGWIEPDPLPIKATALIDGVVDQVHVLEGQQVAKGEPLATLIDDDARLALSAAEEYHRTLVASLAAQQAAIVSAKRRHDSSCAMMQAALTLQEEAADQHTRFTNLPKGSVPESEVVSARLRHDRARLQRISAEADAAEAEAEITRLTLETRVREAEVAAAVVKLDQAKLALERTRILSPVDGRVLRLTAMPGQKKMLVMDDPDSSTIAILYQPDQLQVRVDVPLADAAGLSVGQQAKIRCSLLPDRVFSGEVARITGAADLQRNTLQAKVRIIEPIDQLRPEMLCRVEFFGVAASSGSTAGSLATWIPQSALSEGSVWVCDPETRRVAKRAVRSASETRDGHVRIAEGLRPGEHVVLAPQHLREAQRVNPITKQP